MHVQSARRSDDHLENGSAATLLRRRFKLKIVVRSSSIVTGLFRPSGARKAGHKAIAEASEAHEARIARFSAVVSAGCPTTSWGWSKTVPGC